MKKSISILVLSFLILSWFFYSCESNEGDQIDVNISPKEFSSLKLDENTIILDVRTQEEFDQGHVEKAILIDIYKSDFYENVNRLDTSLTYYVYCRTGSRSLKAVKYMRGVGFSKAYNILGGISQLKLENVNIVK